MRLDVNALHFISKEEIRVLTAIEMGMRNHEFVPVHLIERISHLKRANTYKVIMLLLKNKLVNRDSQKYEGFRLTYLGYDYLALYVFIKRGTIKSVYGKMGVGKESDIYMCYTPTGERVVLKFARLGRVSFRAIKNKRDYLQDRKNYNWLYLSRLASIKEFTFMEILHKHGFPTPKPHDSNRHGIVMSLIDGYTLCGVRELGEAQRIFEELVDILKRLAECGLIHSDFNEFNLMVTKDQKVRIIDFPQMVSTHHPNAKELYDRDMHGLVLWFTKKYGVNVGTIPELKDIELKTRLDIEVKASGFLNKELDKDLQDLDLLDNYNNLVREEGLYADVGEINSDNDEEMWDGNNSDYDGAERAEDYAEIKDEEGAESENSAEENNEDGIEKNHNKKGTKNVKWEDEEGKKDEKNGEKVEEENVEGAEKKGEEEEDDSDDDDEDEDEEDSEEEEDDGAEKIDKKKIPREKKVKEPKKKATDDKDKLNSKEFINKVMKKKFKPRKVIKNNSNKGKKKNTIDKNDLIF